MQSPFLKKVTFRHTGHIGDIIAFLPSYFALGGTHLNITDDPWIQPPMSGFKYDSVKPLLESQGIHVTFNQANSIDYDVAGWRECYEDKLSLLDAQARYLNIVDRRTGHMDVSKPWIKVEADPACEGKVIFNRSHRYRNEKFPWEKVVKHYSDNALFIGTPLEHEDFVMRFGDVPHYKTADCLAVAKAIAGCKLFVGNQSSAFWIAAALHKPLIQEVFPPDPNSQVKYKGAQYCFDEKITLPEIS